eukprot:4341928-Prymnesium_polylepis.1
MGREGGSLLTTELSTAGAIRINLDTASGCATAKRATVPPPHDIPASTTGPSFGSTPMIQSTA